MKGSFLHFTASYFEVNYGEIFGFLDPNGASFDVFSILRHSDG
ncbi:hypothetical protein [Caldisericum exile]